MSLFLAGPARADLPPPETLGCQMASEGDACDPAGPSSDGGTKTGTCRKSTCTKLDYANWNKDASASPPTVEYDCLKCVVGTDASPDSSSASGGTGGAGTGGGAATGGAPGTGGSAPKSGSSGCTVGGARTAFGPWLLAGGFAAAIWFARRRR